MFPHGKTAKTSTRQKSSERSQSHLKAQRLIVECLKKVRPCVLSLQDVNKERSHFHRYRLSRIKSIIEVNQLKNFFIQQLSEFVGSKAWSQLRKFVHYLEVFDPEIPEHWRNLVYEAIEAIIAIEKVYVNFTQNTTLSVKFVGKCCDLYGELNSFAEVNQNNKLVPVGDSKVTT